MSEKMINRLVAFGVFFVSAFVYLKTLSTTVVFWDVGEFCAASWLLQVPHPPGSPLFLLLARVVSIIPFYSDIAARMHAISAIGSALSIMFLYLSSVKVITQFRGRPSSSLDKLIVYGASAIGALTLAFTTTYWDNAIEAEVYGLSMLFVSMIIWLALRWWEKADQPHSEKYLLLIAYLVGLSTGVHLLSLLALFTIMMIVYFRYHDYTREQIIRFGVIAIPAFLIIYPGIVQVLPSVLDGDYKGFQSELLPFIPPIVLLIVGYFAYKSYKEKKKILNIACLSFLFIAFGYTTYIEVIMRSNVHTPMNENNPSNLTRLVSYLSREQYGDTPLLKGQSWDNELQGFREKLFPRRYDNEAMHEPTRTNYTSDMDFFIRYQMNHMFMRYLFWNFVGAEGDWQDAGWNGKDTWGIPLLLSLFGLFYHVWKDWKNSLPFIVLFLVMGTAFAFYANMQEPQPRERDYFYVGSMYAMALWIGIGIVGIIDLLKKKLADEKTSKTAATAILAVTMIASPVNLMRVNWFEHDRSQNYVAWDYSYDLLQSCDQDAILFTNGDNDTFPLWYLQDVEGIRRDVRIVNLSLVNTPWYILQLKSETPHGAKKVAITLSDGQINQIGPMGWKPRQMELPISKEIAERYMQTDAPRTSGKIIVDSTALKQGKITFTMNGVPYSQDMRIVRVQDMMVWEIVKSNHWERPIHFAVTVSPDGRIGLDNYTWMQGLTYKLKPFKNDSQQGGLDPEIMYEQLMAENVTPSKTPQRGYLYRNLNNPKVYYDENVQRMMLNYRLGFMRLADYYSREEHNKEKAIKIMARMEEIMPINVLPSLEWRLTIQAMGMYSDLGDMKNFDIYSKNVETKCWELINSGKVDPEAYAYRALLEIYDTRKDYNSAIKLLNDLVAVYPNDPSLKQQINRYEQLMKGSSMTDTSKPLSK